MNAPWSLLCAVDTAPLRAWLEDTAPPWPTLPDASKPERVRDLPAPLWSDIVSAVLDVLDPADHLRAEDVLLARVRPGQSHPMHVDAQPDDHLTRVHVPVLTNPGVWFEWEDCPGRVHFEAGKAYTFDTTRRHSFGNDGATDRVHLMFDVRVSDEVLRRWQNGGAK